MSKVSFRYKERGSATFEKVLRPLINLEMYSAIDEEGYIVEDMLVDSGADLSLLPYRQGKLFILDIESGDEIEIRGDCPVFQAYSLSPSLKIQDWPDGI